ncbi:MAG: hypothetical protein ABW047_15860 [Nitrospiraceae bacterium]
MATDRLLKGELLMGTTKYSVPTERHGAEGSAQAGTTVSKVCNRGSYLVVRSQVLHEIRFTSYDGGSTKFRILNWRVARFIPSLAAHRLDCR